MRRLLVRVVTLLFLFSVPYDEYLAIWVVNLIEAFIKVTMRTLVRYRLEQLAAYVCQVPGFRDPMPYPFRWDPVPSLVFFDVSYQFTHLKIILHTSDILKPLPNAVKILRISLIGRTPRG